tara:strand:- start:6303 stop:6521 length:219 start_codon:yes stop_codon:yes gene_type:complete
VTHAPASANAVWVKLGANIKAPANVTEVTIESATCFEVFPRARASTAPRFATTITRDRFGAATDAHRAVAAA